ncbi:MAG TPA: ATP-binding protein [Longilinea sp.]|nr:ATP-binding protein [Longilinea sp.]
MSIRLRLSFLFSTILALTLIIVGVVVYITQWQYTQNWLKNDLEVSSDTLGQSVLQTYLNSKPHQNSPSGPPPPVPFQTYSSDQTFHQLSQSEIVRVLDPDGNLVASPYGSPGDALPLSAEGLKTLQNQQEWWENDVVSGNSLLIYNRPIIANGSVVAILQVARPLTERDQSLQALAIVLIAVTLISTLAAFGFGWLLSGIALRPIQQITQTAQSIGAERNFTRRVDYTGPNDEVGRLAVTFNSMLAQLHDAYQKVAHSLEMQRDFVADVSHELRTPLTTLRGNLGLLKRTPQIPADEQADILEDMVDESDRLIRLVNDLLVLARADAGRNLTKEPIDLSPIIEETCRQVRLLDQTRQISTDLQQEIMVIGDRDAIKQIMLILLDNALKHSEGAILVSAKQEHAQATIIVQDEGAGISPDKLEHVFDRFYRGDDHLLVTGVGLGLPIAKALAEGQGGTITIESEVGKGSTVTVFLPTA